MTWRKAVAKAGVLLYLTPYVPLPFGLPILPAAGFAGLFLLLLAAVLPSGEGETFGSMWPLVGYDNAIDAPYVAGPWQGRCLEMDGMAAERNVTQGMTHIVQCHEDHP